MKIPEIDLDEHYRSRVAVLEGNYGYLHDLLVEHIHKPHEKPRGPVYCCQWMSDHREYFSPAGVFPSAPYCPSCGRSQYAS